MSTNTISIAVSEPIAEYIDHRVKSGGYGNRSEYIRDLVRKDQREQAIERFRGLVEQGLSSGAGLEDTDSDHEELYRIARGE